MVEWPHWAILIYGYMMIGLGFFLGWNFFS